MALIRWRPTARPLARFDPDFGEEMARFFDETRSRWGGEGELTAWSPSINVYEENDRIVMEAELPGMKKDQIEVSVHDHMLTVSGERKEEKEVKEDDFYRHERRYGAFSRSISLPSTVDSKKIDASYKDGVLKLTIPKAEQAKAKRVEVH